MLVDITLPWFTCFSYAICKLKLNKKNIFNSLFVPISQIACPQLLMSVKTVLPIELFPNIKITWYKNHVDLNNRLRSEKNKCINTILIRDRIAILHTF